MRRPNSSFPALLNGDPLPSPGVQAGRCGWFRSGRSSSPGSAGVPPAPCSCKQPPSHRPARPGRAGPPEPMRPVRRLPSPGVQPGRHGWFRSRRSSSPGSAGVSPAPCSCKQPPIHRPARPGRAGPPEPMRPVRRLPSPGVQPGRHGWFRSNRSLPPGARASRPHLFPANNLPSTANPLQSPPNPPLRGSLRSKCGR